MPKLKKNPKTNRSNKSKPTKHSIVGVAFYLPGYRRFMKRIGTSRDKRVRGVHPAYIVGEQGNRYIEFGITSDEHFRNSKSYSPATGCDGRDNFMKNKPNKGLKAAHKSSPDYESITLSDKAKAKVNEVIGKFGRKRKKK